MSVSYRGEDRAADQLGDLRDYGVSEGGNATFVQFSGNPISHSLNGGVGIPPIKCSKFTECRPPLSKLLSERSDVIALAANFVRVGNDPDPLSGMWRANRGSRYAMPFRVIPERGQIADHALHPSTEQLCDVFHNNEAGSNVANEASVF